MTDGHQADDLLGYLRATLNDDTLSFAEAPVPVSGGFEAEIYAFRLAGGSESITGPLILRKYPPDCGAQRVAWEAGIQSAVHRQGFPAPDVLLTCDDSAVIGGAFTVMARADGVMLMQDAFRFTTLLRNPGRPLSLIAKRLAETQAALHGLNASEATRGLAAPTVEEHLGALRARVSMLADEGLGRGLEWLQSRVPANRNGTVVCHGDFHPLNVLSHRGRVTGVIDWSLSAVADPAFDVGNTIALITLAPVQLPGPLAGIAGRMRGGLAKLYLDKYQSLHSIDMNDVPYYEALRCLRALVWNAESAAGTALGDNPWNSPATSKEVAARFRELTGIDAGGASPMAG